MRIKRAVAIEPNNAAPPTAVRRLLSDISVEELERLATEVIREHRHRLQRAQELFEVLELAEEPVSNAAKRLQLRQEYRLAMLNLHAQHQLVSLIVAVLGYVPNVDDPPSAID